MHFRLIQAHRCLTKNRLTQIRLSFRILKAQIVLEIYRLTNERKLTQSQAGDLLAISQPEVSRMFKGNFREYSVERLMGFLTAFGRAVEIVARPRKRSGKGGRITFSPVAA